VIQSVARLYVHLPWYFGLSVVFGSLHPIPGLLFVLGLTIALGHLGLACSYWHFDAKRSADMLTTSPAKEPTSPTFPVIVSGLVMLVAFVSPLVEPIIGHTVPQLVTIGVLMSARGHRASLRHFSTTTEQTQPFMFSFVVASGWALYALVLFVQVLGAINGNNHTAGLVAAPLAMTASVRMYVAIYCRPPKKLRHLVCRASGAVGSLVPSWLVAGPEVSATESLLVTLRRRALYMLADAGAAVVDEQGMLLLHSAVALVSEDETALGKNEHEFESELARAFEYLGHTGQDDSPRPRPERAGARADASPQDVDLPLSTELPADVLTTQPEPAAAAGPCHCDVDGAGIVVQPTSEGSPGRGIRRCMSEPFVLPSRSAPKQLAPLARAAEVVPDCCATLPAEGTDRSDVSGAPAVRSVVSAEMPPASTKTDSTASPTDPACCGGGATTLIASSVDQGSDEARSTASCDVLIPASQSAATRTSVSELCARAVASLTAMGVEIDKAAQAHCLSALKLVCSDAQAAARVASDTDALMQETLCALQFLGSVEFTGDDAEQAKAEEPAQTVLPSMVFWVGYKGASTEASDALVASLAERGVSTRCFVCAKKCLRAMSKVEEELRAKPFAVVADRQSEQRIRAYLSSKLPGSQVQVIVTDELEDVEVQQIECMLLGKAPSAEGSKPQHQASPGSTCSTNDDLQLCVAGCDVSDIADSV